jgi:hypothetical protein
MTKVCFFNETSRQGDEKGGISKGRFPCSFPTGNGLSLFFLPLTDDYFPQIRKNTRQWKTDMKKVELLSVKADLYFVHFLKKCIR